MEAFESFVAISLEAEGFVVSEAVKFPVALPTKKVSHAETQRHGYEVDLVGARGDKLVLATVKSFLGSRGVVAEDVTGATPNSVRVKRYHLLNNQVIRETVAELAAARYGYSPDQIEFRLYVGRFAVPARGENESAVREWASNTHVGSGPIQVYNLQQVVENVRAVASSTQYRDNAVLVTIKVLEAAGALKPMQAYSE
jgi:hypothetical protein